MESYISVAQLALSSMLQTDRRTDTSCTITCSRTAQVLARRLGPAPNSLSVKTYGPVLEACQTGNMAFLLFSTVNDINDFRRFDNFRIGNSPCLYFHLKFYLCGFTCILFLFCCLPRLLLTSISQSNAMQVVYSMECTCLEYEGWWVIGEKVTQILSDRTTFSMLSYGNN